MNILVVDDSEEQRELLAAVLRQAGYRSLLFAESAAEALTRIGVETGKGLSDRIDVVLMDIVMPNVDGLAACRKIRDDERFEHLPIIVVTAKTEASDIKAAYAAGATDYIRKPVIPPELVARVSMAMTMREEFHHRLERERELTDQTRQLADQVEDLKSLSGRLCICAKCKKVQTSSGLWQRLEDYLEDMLNARITSALCTRCRREPSGNAFKRS